MLLRKDDPWIEELGIPDIRDWRVVDGDGRSVGFVETVVGDRQGFEALLTGANERYPADDVEIGDHVVRLRQALQRPSESVGFGSTAFRRFDEAYRRHFQSTYGDDDGFEAMRPAYEFGRGIALDADYWGRSFERAEEDVRAEYVSRGLTPAYDSARGAVRFAYEAAQQLGRYEESGMTREGNQIVAPDRRTAREWARTGASMEMGEPGSDDGPAREGG